MLNVFIGNLFDQIACLCIACRVLTKYLDYTTPRDIWFSQDLDSLKFPISLESKKTRFIITSELCSNLKSLKYFKQKWYIYCLTKTFIFICFWCYRLLHAVSTPMGKCLGLFMSDVYTVCDMGASNLYRLQKVVFIP